MMKRLSAITILFLMLTTVVMAQGTVKGTIFDKANGEALAFVSVAVSPKGSTTIAGGATTDTQGKFNITGLKYGTYTMTLSFVGYKTVMREFTLTADNQTRTYTAINMAEDSHVLNEVKVTGQRSMMKLEVDRKVFDVASNIANVGQTASEVLDNIPSVEVDNDGNVSLRGNSSVEVWINGRSAGLTSDNMGQILQQIPSESIDRIEVLDNPSAKYSAEGSAGIINIVLKKDRKAGYYGSLQAGADTRGGANVGGNFNYSSPKVDFFVNIGLRHRRDEGHSKSDQLYTSDVAGIKSGYFSRYDTENEQKGNNLFSRAGITWHITDNDDISFTGMLMRGKHNSWSNTPYTYGYVAGSPTAMTVAQEGDVMTSMRYRNTTNGGPMTMLNGELNYRHKFSETHFIDFTASGNSWNSDMNDLYRDSLTQSYELDADGKLVPVSNPVTYAYESRPMNVRNNRYEIRLDYENKLSDVIKLQIGYNGNFSKEDTPNQTFRADNWNGEGMEPDKDLYNHFIYKNNIHAGYVTANMSFGKLGVMAGLRGEYWTVDTESRNWAADHPEDIVAGTVGNNATNPETLPYKKSFFQLFPSLFVTYQLTPTQQLQLNYTRRLRRPWGGQLNSFRNTSDASMISFGNPELTPEFSNSFSLNYLKTWDQHSLLVSAYYRPTTDVMQRVNYRDAGSSTMYSTTINVTKSVSSGLEVTSKNKIASFLDLTTNVNAYYSKLDGFNTIIEGQTVSGQSNSNFTWNARMTASFKLPYDISIQATGRYNSRELITQGHRPASYLVDLGVRKNFFNRLLTLSINCRDLLDSRKRESFTEGTGYTRYQLNRRGGRKVNFTLTWNFGNGNAKKRRMQEQQGDDDDTFSGGGYDM